MGSNQTESHHWQSFGVSVTGSTHLNESALKQDALHWLPVSGRGARVALAVADGHSSGQSFRSAKGSSFAVLVASEVLREFVSSLARETDYLILEKWAREELPQLIYERWRDEVDTDLLKHPLLPEEQAIFGLSSQEVVSRNPKRFVPYGTTLMGVAVTNHYLVALQIGDGTISMINHEGQCETLIEPNERLDKSSLCQQDALHRFRCRVVPLSGNPPVLVWLCTDGYRNQFATEDNFQDRFRGVLDSLRKDGLLCVNQHLHEWMHRTAAQPGTGDMTLGVLYRLEDYHRHAHLRQKQKQLYDPHPELQ